MNAIPTSVWRGEGKARLSDDLSENVKRLAEAAQAIVARFPHATPRIVFQDPSSNEPERQCRQTILGGMRRRLELARGRMHRPKVLFPDEPALGLDPQSREQRGVPANEGVTTPRRCPRFPD